MVSIAVLNYQRLPGNWFAWDLSSGSMIAGVWGSFLFGSSITNPCVE